jgi:hypothetical protein
MTWVIDHFDPCLVDGSMAIFSDVVMPGLDITTGHEHICEISLLDDAGIQDQDSNMFRSILECPMFVQQRPETAHEVST